jgi:membrane protein YdbS with pleckstrin-like domain
VSENTQRELRLLQQVTIASMLVGFFGMNIAFPWEERWPNTFLSSFMVFGIIIIMMIVFCQIIKRVISNRRFRISSAKNDKL